MTMPWLVICLIIVTVAYVSVCHYMVFQNSFIVPFTALQHSVHVAFIHSNRFLLMYCIIMTHMLCRDVADFLLLTLHL